MKLEVPGFRPRVIDDSLYRLLDDFRAFRHKFRHSYAFELDWRESSWWLASLVQPPRPSTPRCETSSGSWTSSSENLSRVARPGSGEGCRLGLFADHGKPASFHSAAGSDEAGGAPAWQPGFGTHLVSGSASVTLQGFIVFLPRRPESKFRGPGSRVNPPQATPKPSQRPRGTPQELRPTNAPKSPSALRAGLSANALLAREPTRADSAAVCPDPRPEKKEAPANCAGARLSGIVPESLLR